MQLELLQIELLEDITKIKYSERVSIDTLSEQQKIFREAVAAKNSIEIDANNVTQIDTASLQLLLAFIRSAQQASLALTWKNPSPEFLKAATLLGLSSLLDLESIRG